MFLAASEKGFPFNSILQGHYSSGLPLDALSGLQ